MWSLVISDKQEREVLSRDVETSVEFGDDVDRRRLESHGEDTIYTVAPIVVERQQVPRLVQWNGRHRVSR